MNTSWTPTALGSILQPVDRSESLDPTAEYRLLGIRLDGNGPFLRERRLGSEIAAKTLSKVCEADFIYSRLFAWRGAFGVIDSELDGAYVSNEFPTFTPKAGEVDVRFVDLWFRLKDTLRVVEADCTGSTPLTRNRYKESFFLALAIPLPPLPVQRRIVAKVEELVAKIEEARGLRQSSAIARDRIIATSLKSVFDRDLIGQMQEALPLAQAARVSRGKFTHRPRNEPRFYGGDVPFIQINDISSSKRYISRYSQTLNEHGLKISRLFPAGTVVIAITGATVGVMGILAIDSCFPDSIVGIEAYPEKTLPEYVYWALEHVKSNALAEATQTTQPNINLKILNRLSIPVPPLPEQRRIVAYLDDLQAKVDSLKALQAQTQAELDALLPSILDKAFKGEL